MSLVLASSWRVVNQDGGCPNSFLMISLYILGTVDYGKYLEGEILSALRVCTRPCEGPSFGRGDGCGSGGGSMEAAALGRHNR
jgi:hypothetical protein